MGKNVFRSPKVLVGVGVALVAVVAVVCFFMFRSKAGKLAAALPEDAIAVARIDAVKLFTDNKWLSEVIEKNVSKDDLKETGLDFLTPGYAFAYQEYLGCVVSLDKEARFLKFVTDDGDIENQRGLKWGTAFRNFLVASDGDRAMLVGPVTRSGQDALRNKVCKWMGQKKCPVDENVIKAVDDGKGFFTLAMNFDNLPASVKEQITDAWDLMDVKGRESINLSDINIFADLSFTSDELALELGVVGFSEEVLTGLSVAKPINGSLAGTCGDRPFLHAEFAMDGAKVMNTVDKVIGMIPFARGQWNRFNTIIGVESIVKSINGDVSVTMPGMPYLQCGMPELLVQAELKDNAFMNHVGNWGRGWFRFSNYNGNIYQVDGLDAELYFGTKDNRLVFAAGSRMLGETPKGKQSLPEEAKGSLGYICMNLEETGMWNQVFHVLSLYPAFKDFAKNVERLKTFNRLMLVFKDNAHVRLSLRKWN